MRRLTLLAAASAIASACGGLIASPPGAIDGDLPPGDDAGLVDSAWDGSSFEASACGDHTVGQVSSGGVCTAGEKWSCGATAYVATCHCPSATCSCFSDGIFRMDVPYSGCPDCSTALSALNVCGFPR